MSALRQRGHDVATFSRHEAVTPDIVHFTGDHQRLAESAAALRAWSPDVVVDLILSSGQQARTLVDLFRGFTQRIVVVSSIDVYRACSVLHRLEDGFEPVPLTEESRLRATRAYPAESVRAMQSVFGWVDDDYDKIPVEREILSADGIRGTVLRLPIVYGPGDRLHRLAPLLAHMDAGTGDYVMAGSIARWRGPRGYVANVAHAIALATTDERTAGRTYNVAEPENFSEGDWARQVASAIGWHGRIVVVPDSDAPPNPLLRGNLEQHWSADSTRIRQELGYAEVVPLADAIRKTVAWERSLAVRS